MYISDKPDESSILALKGRDSYMSCSLCTLPTRVYHSQNQVYNSLSSSDDDEDAITTMMRHMGSFRNRSTHMFTTGYPIRDVISTVRIHLLVAGYNLCGRERAADIVVAKRSLITNSAS